MNQWLFSGGRPPWDLCVMCSVSAALNVPIGCRVKSCRCSWAASACFKELMCLGLCRRCMRGAWGHSTALSCARCCEWWSTCPSSPTTSTRPPPHRAPLETSSSSSAITPTWRCAAPQHGPDSVSCVGSSRGTVRVTPALLGGASPITLSTLPETDSLHCTSLIRASFH